VSKDAFLGCLDAERASARLLDQGFHPLQHLVARARQLAFLLLEATLKGASR